MRIIHEKGAVGVMTFESGMIGIVGGIGAVGEDMVRCADQSYIVGFGSHGKMETVEFYVI